MNYKRNPIGLFLDKRTPPEGLLMLLLAILVGAVTGLGAVLFIHLISTIQGGAYSSLTFALPHVGIWSFLIIPVAGALLAGPLIAWFAREAKGHGVPEVMQALVIRGGRIRPRVAVAKILASALCIGSGGSAGREGPIVQVGSAFGSATGQVLQLSDERIKNLVACGAAAGISATFNAPIAGVAFAIEVLMSGLQVRMFGNVVIAAVSASIVSQMFLGDRPAFTVPTYTLESPLEIFLYLLLGLVAAVIGVMFIRVLDKFERVFDDWDFPLALKPAVGAVFLGFTGMAYIHFSGHDFQSLQTLAAHQLIEIKPHIFGSGFGFIEKALLGEATFWPLLLLVFLKPLATCFTLGSGNSGGVFAPSLFTGAMLGGATGILFSHWFPDIAGPPGAYALVGMAAVFAACARAPLTAILIVFEMSNDYSLILPLMVAAVTASNVAQQLYHESIYTTKLTRRGIRFVGGRDMDIMQSVLVSEVMNSEPVVVDKDEPVPQLYRLFQETNYLGFPVVEKHGKLWGIVTLQDIEKVLSQSDTQVRNLQVKDVAVVDPVTVFADEPIWTAIQKMAPRDLARLPVVSRKDPGKLIGLISRSDILRAYDVGIVRKQRGQMLEGNITLRREQHNAFVEIRLRSGQRAVGVMLKDLELTESVNVVSIERNGVLHIPRGSTHFMSGDIVTLFARKEAIKLATSQFTDVAEGS